MKEIDELAAIMERLRDPLSGCPWDRAQTINTILPYSFEEIHELAEAIDGGKWEAVRDELGDLLFHIIFYARISEEEGQFTLADVARVICDKLLRRHPHVFGPSENMSGNDRTASWEGIKQDERESQKLNETAQISTFAGIGKTLPAMIRALKLQRRAAGVGFDWKERLPVLQKLEEEIAELRDELLGDGDRNRIESEIGDVLFSSVNLARHCGIDAENALRLCNRRFEKRFGYIVTTLARQGRRPENASLDELEILWQEAKNQ
ncbi:MAG: nucleoside triphosphate pyrophosphohydrolase [Gammaproteobacteria bacterium]|jgi:MazG family protein|nr:MAG: nucleoside triphosphate pyrophosphohydrolase [Gammaproteobacteria bacterium]